MDNKAAIHRGEICPYCLNPTQRSPGKFGMMIKCFPCNAWVGTDKQGNALGILADAKLRAKRKEWFELKKKCEPWFKPWEFQNIVKLMGGHFSDNVFLLTSKELENILYRLRDFYYHRTRDTCISSSSLKDQFKINYERY